MSVSLLVMEFSKYYLWEMLFKLRDTSGSGIIYPTSEATSFAFLVSMTPRRVCALGHGDAADTVILACLRSPLTPGGGRTAAGTAQARWAYQVCK